MRVLNLPEPIILQDQPWQGRTVIERFEDQTADTNIAFVLLTDDDRVVSGGDKNEERWRSRQNVILELGFFFGKLNRKTGRVFLLHRGPLELPSDIAGIIYISIDHGIKSAGERIRMELAALTGE